MNGKKARALRHLKSGNLNIRDVKIISQSMTNETKRLATRPKPKKLRARDPLLPIEPTWPATADQRAQSRPVIVVNPLRAITYKHGSMHVARFHIGVRSNRQAHTLPKHILDAAAA